MTILSRLLAGLIPLAGLAADLPDLAIPRGAGVNIHFLRGHEKDIELIATAGFKFIRMDMGWAGIERQRGQYDWSAQDELLANLEKRGLRALLILDYSNPLYEETISSRDPVSGQTHSDTASPRHPESVAAFARWAAAAAEHFRGRRVIWEIWNEPNIGFWKPKPEVNRYLDLARATCEAIRKADPHATIIAPASSEFPWPFLETLCQSGLLEQLDAVSVHPYRKPQRSPETAAEDYLRLRHLIERYTPAGKRALPILSGEWGYSSNTKGVSEENQAAFLVRQQLHNLLCGIPVSIWYDWKNDGADPAENEHNFGTVWPDLKPKPAYLAMEVFARELGGFTIARRLDRRDSSEFILLLTNAVGQQKLAAWTTAGARDIELPLDLPADSLALVDGHGQKQPCQVDQGKLRLRLTGLPQYLALAKPSPRL